MVDLHIHTTHSDGRLNPAQVVEYAVRRGLRAIAVTDHDTISGNEAARAAGAAQGLPVIAGVEISTEAGGATFHLLGYGMTRITAPVRQTLDFFVRSRGNRNPQMVAKLQALGYPITLEEVLEVAGDAVVGRPHIAQVLVDKGIVRSTQEAFDRYLGRGAAAYVDKQRLAPEAACRLILDAGGIPVLAHPGILEQEHPGRLEGLVELLLDAGLAGLEAYYSSHSAAQVARYRELARRYGLLVTGGSDFHGVAAGSPDLGVGFGSLRVPLTCYEELRARLAAASPAPEPSAPASQNSYPDA